MSTETEIFPLRESLVAEVKKEVLRELRDGAGPGRLVLVRREQVAEGDKLLTELWGVDAKTSHAEQTNRNAQDALERAQSKRTRADAEGWPDKYADAPTDADLAALAERANDAFNQLEGLRQWRDGLAQRIRREFVAVTGSRLDLTRPPQQQ